MTIYCKTCGAPNEDDAVYCEKCGAALEKGIPEEVRGTKGTGDILSEALDVLSKNSMMVVPYLIPMVLTLISISVTWGSIFSVNKIGPGEFEFGTEALYENALAFAGVASVLGILSWIASTAATAFAIVMTYSAVNGKKLTLSQAWEKIGAGKIIILLIAAIITGILTILGLLALCIGAVIVAILLVFVKQGILIDNLELGETFGNSYRIAKKNFWDIVILGIVYIILAVIAGIIPFLNAILSPVVSLYGTVAFTLLYLDRR
ncbi:MAG: zinc-ribbon domain-containing protein [Euryarchaeota archaeon]|nr:zinc-ribbon domain-containing protein [Euryarchaeota archaeon]